MEFEQINNKLFKPIFQYEFHSKVAFATDSNLHCLHGSYRMAWSCKINDKLRRF